MKTISELKNHAGAGSCKLGNSCHDGRSRVNVRQDTDAKYEIEGSRLEPSGKEVAFDQINILQSSGRNLLTRDIEHTPGEVEQRQSAAARQQRQGNCTIATTDV